MSIQRVSSDTPTCASRWKYDVFISFRGEDTRKTFTSHLYDALVRKGINVFRDDEELERGKSISLELVKAIEESRFSIIVFSKNYASSTWCLEETAKIVECRNTRGQIVFPIFYNVDPSIVRKQSGVYQEAFAIYEETFSENKQKVQLWRNALIEIANLSGWDANNRQESEFIQHIVKEISIRLSPTTRMNFEGLIGIHSRLEELRKKIGTGCNDIRMIGIWGMGGIGKTTIARVFHDINSCQFEGSAFLANVREISKKSGLVTLQKQLLSKILGGKDNNICDEYDGINEIERILRHKKVLLVVDDVDDIKQLHKLVKHHEWFGLGSRIIITTRDKHLLMTHEVDEVYEAKELNCDEALELLILKAFKNHQPSEDYLKLSEDVVEYAGGLPLVLELFGHFLFRRPKDQWNDAIERLKKDSNKEILDILQISFDGLKDSEKKIFLDVACFFNGENIEYVTRILHSCGFHPTIGINVLLEKSLIKISYGNTLRMHDLLQEMGRQIVKRECIEEPGKRRRLWDEEDIHHVLTKNMGTERVEAIIFGKMLNVSASPKAFSKMSNLRLLKIRKVQLPKGLEYLSDELRLLDWDGCPLKSLPSNFQLNKLVELKMDSSRIEQLRKGNKFQQPFNMLKSISFQYCKSLTETPDFTEIPNLVKLTLKGCSRLREIHPSLLVHKKIERLDLAYCSSLETLPSKIHMESLIDLTLSGCSKLKRFPEIIGSMEYLLWLSLDETAIKELPLSVELLSGLEYLNLNGCKNLSSLPSTINGLKSLEFLCLHRCSRLVSLPDTISGLESLKALYLCGCSKLESVPETLGRVESLRTLLLDETAIRQHASSIFSIKNLSNLKFDGCKGSPSKSFFKRSSNPMALILPSLPSNLCYLTMLSLEDCNLGEGAITSELLGSFISLEDLNLSRNNFVLLPASINRLYKLRNLKLSYCRRLQILPELPSKVERLHVNGCVSLETLSNALRLCISNSIQIQSEYCSQLNGSEAFSIMKEHLKVVTNQSNEFSMVVPGSEVPEWFKHKSDGDSIIIEKPPDLNNNNCKLMGYVVCSSFFVQIISFASLCCYPFSGVLAYYDNPSNEDPIQNFSNLWLLYLPHHEIERFHKNHDPKFSIDTRRSDKGKFEVSRVGVHPVYENEDFVEFH